MKNYSSWAFIPTEVRYCPNLTAKAVLLFGEIAALSHHTGYCFASNAYFAELFGVTERTIRNWLGQLREAGFVNVEVERSHKGTRRQVYLAETLRVRCGIAHSTQRGASRSGNKVESSRSESEQKDGNKTPRRHRVDSEIRAEANAKVNTSSQESEIKDTRKDKLHKLTQKVGSKSPAVAFGSDPLRGGGKKHVGGVEKSCHRTTTSTSRTFKKKKNYKKKSFSRKQREALGNSKFSKRAASRKGDVSRFYSS